MRTLKINRLRTGLVLSFFLLIGAFYMVRAAEEPSIENHPKVRATVFHYASEDTSPGAFADPNNWEEGASPSTRPCGNGENKPCEINAADEQDLSDVLEGKTNTQVLNIVTSKRL